MRKQDLALLLGYFSHQREIINELMGKIQKADTSTEERTIALGYLLHNLYCALEDLFREVADTFENKIEDPSRYHRELLKRMALEVPKIRPRLLSRESHQLLEELRGFRHVFRHSYTYSLIPEKVEALKEKILSGWAAVEKDLGDFELFLGKQLEKQS
ncbi:hypothetical protein [Ammonifex thiophilus]|uniref:HepT-like domain-containing protein n=1 Tax=Ammonifex thiophilus TaxID=444093 RepID=A0A3D8P3K4_9THEO|nr:hypothetical protein [Ammonifex thiophilus]RDV81206.1 hypothetical protein DXX99_09720 [Ammonifex thiophilus]